MLKALNAKPTEVPNMGCLIGFSVSCNRQRNSAFVTLCMLSNSSCFFKNNFFPKKNLPGMLSEYQTISGSIQNACPDRGPNCLQRLSAYD